MLERGLSDETINVLKSMMNPTVLAFLQMSGGDLRKVILDKLGPQISAALQKNMAAEVEVYEQTRSILGSVRRLYEVGSPVPATLILLFSVIVPFGKAALVAWALFIANAEDAGGRCDSWKRSPNGRWRTSSSSPCSLRISPRRPAPRRPRTQCGASAARVRRPLQRRLLLVRGVLPVLAGVTADHRAAISSRFFF